MDQLTKKSLQLFEYALVNNLVGNSGDLCKRIGLVPSNLSAIRTGKRTFTHEQLHELAKLTKADMNWIYGFSTTMFRPVAKNSPIERMRQALAEIENAMKSGGKK